MNWLKNLFKHKHKHKWETIPQLGVRDWNAGYVPGNFYTYHIQWCPKCREKRPLRCDKCGCIWPELGTVP